MIYNIYIYNINIIIIIYKMNIYSILDTFYFGKVLKQIEISILTFFVKCKLRKMELSLKTLYLVSY